jgi:hypothetical protein
LRIHIQTVAIEAKIPIVPKPVSILLFRLSLLFLLLVRVGADEEVVSDGSREDEGIILGRCGAADVEDGSREDEGIILGGCGAADVEVRAQRKLELESI